MTSVFIGVLAGVAVLLVSIGLVGLFVDRQFTKFLGMLSLSMILALAAYVPAEFQIIKDRQLNYAHTITCNQSVISRQNSMILGGQVTIAELADPEIKTETGISTITVLGECEEDAQ